MKEEDWNITRSDKERKILEIYDKNTKTILSIEVKKHFKKIPISLKYFLCNHQWSIIKMNGILMLKVA
jgi:hypothetical protein